MTKRLVFEILGVIAAFTVGGFVAMPSLVNEARAIHFPLIRALELHHKKMGAYPKKLIELKQTVPDLDLEPFKGYDDHEECILSRSYCLNKDGGFYLSMPGMGLVTCDFESNRSTDFVCDD